MIHGGSMGQRLATGVRVAIVGIAMLAASGAGNGASAADDAVLADLGNDGKLTNCIDPAFPPMEFYEGSDTSNPVGFDIDLTRAIAEKLEVEAEFIPLEFTGLLPGLQGGRCDIVASGIYLTAERAQTFGAQPYYDSSMILVTLADNDSVNAPEDLSGKTVAVQSGTNYQKMIEALDAQLKADGSDGITIQTYPKQTDADQQVVLGRADATITQDTEMAFREQEQPGVFRIAYTYPEKQTFAIYYGKDKTALGSALNETVEGMRSDGTLANIATTWNLPTEGVEFAREVGTEASPEASPAS